MNESKISVRYAKALFLLGKEKNVLGTIVTDMKLVGELCSTVKDFWLMVESPIIKTSQKRKTVKTVLADKVDAISLNFLDMVFGNRREIFIKDMVRNFLDLCRKDAGVVFAKLTTASETDIEDKTKLSEMLKKAFDSIHRAVMVKILRAYGVPPNLLRAIETMYRDTRAKVVTPDGETEEFEIHAGVLQGDTLPPFSLLSPLTTPFGRQFLGGS